MMKLSTATGYIYGYVQDMETGMWQYIMLDFETGETVFTMDISDKPGYNNMAIGMYAGNSGNALYCPTGYLGLLRLQVCISAGNALPQGGSGSGNAQCVKSGEICGRRRPGRCGRMAEYDHN